MPSSLTPEQQLSAANQQYRTWVNQQIAANGGYYPTIGEINEYKAGMLNTGLYPALDMGVAAPAPGVDINVAPSQFFILGQGGSLNEDRGSGYTGQPLFTAGISDATTLQQFTAAQDAYQLGLEQVYQTQGKDLASQAISAKEALAAAQARVQALQAQLDANAPVDTQPTSSNEAQAASSAVNQRLGQEISPQRETQLSAIDQQYADYRSSGTVIQNAQNQTLLQNSARETQLQNIDSTNTAAGSGTGTNLTNQTTVDARSEYNYKQPPDATAIEPGAAVASQTSISHSEDDAKSAIQSTSDTAVYKDQSTNGSATSDTRSGFSTGIQSTNDKSSGKDSVTILNTGSKNGGSQQYSNNTNTQGGARINKLHAYANYTYRISMYGVPRQTINAIFASKSTPTNQEILANSVFICSDSGRGQNERSSYFPVDLTIDNLELETVTNANNARTRATDVIRFNFEIIEPYTVNFLARLKQLSSDINPNGNWSTMFFVMKIEFLGYNDMGEPITGSSNGDVIPGTTKFIPFTMISMNFKVGSSGGKYKIKAIPCNALALTALDNQIPFHVEVAGTTIEEIFNGSLSSSTDVANIKTTNQEKSTFTTQQNTVNGGNTTVSKGLATALNMNEEQKVKKQKTQSKANSYKFEFLDFIGGSPVTDPQGYFKIQGVPGTSGKSDQEIQQGKVGSLVADLKKNVFRANPGTRITDFIGSIIGVSQYMTEQYASSNGSNQPIDTWKITPVVQFNDIDPKTNYYARDVTYVVAKYSSYGNDAPGFGQAPVKPEQIVKTYKYIYSGDNRDVIDANIEYNMAFFELKNGVPFNYIDRDGVTPGSSQPTTEGASPSTIPKFFMPRYHYTNGLANRQNTGPTTVDLSAIAVQDLMEKLYDNRGDMIRLDFTIVGDPDWISQDYAIMHPSAYGKNPYLDNGSINFSNSVYFNFYFATPNLDYDDNSGLFNPQGNYSEFSGIYYTSMVKSTFSGGKFTQKLTNYRVRTQDQVQTSSVRADSVNPNAPTASNNANNLAEPPTQKVIVKNPTQNPNDGYTPQPQTTNNNSGDIFNDRTGQRVPPVRDGISEDTARSSEYIIGND